MSFPYPEQPVRLARSANTVRPMRTRRLTRPIYPAQEPLATFIGAVSCPVCDAVYAPAQSHEYLLHAPMIALESAFMSMCHFCYRCRRPSCSECWDSANGLCGSCVQELALPFRRELTPLMGALAGKTSSRQSESHVFPAIPQQVPSMPSEAPLRCVYTGRFQQSAHDMVADALITTDPVPVAQQAFPAQRLSVTPSAGQPSTQDDIEAQVAQSSVSRQQASTSKVALIAERVFTALFLIVLSLLVLLVICASLSTQVNAIIAQVLHIDIRAFILSLWSSPRQLFGH